MRARVRKFITCASYSAKPQAVFAELPEVLSLHWFALCCGVVFAKNAKIATAPS
jgi:hypothetical protein